MCSLVRAEVSVIVLPVDLWFVCVRPFCDALEGLSCCLSDDLSVVQPCARVGMAAAGRHSTFLFCGSGSQGAVGSGLGNRAAIALHCCSFCAEI